MQCDAEDATQNSTTIEQPMRPERKIDGSCGVSWKQKTVNVFKLKMGAAALHGKSTTSMNTRQLYAILFTKNLKLRASG